MSDEAIIPTAYCKYCEEHLPVWLGEIDVTGGEQEVDQIPVVFCPKCESLLSINDDIEVNYYSLNEIEDAIGWKVSDEPEL